VRGVSCVGFDCSVTAADQKRPATTTDQQQQLTNNNNNNNGCVREAWLFDPSIDRNRIDSIASVRGVVGFHHSAQQHPSKSIYSGNPVWLPGLMVATRDGCQGFGCQIFEFY
jgi:hypothetical protein